VKSGPIARDGTNSVLNLIGNTPLLSFRRLAADVAPVEIYAKAEWYNPGGSVKDRAALAMVRDGERRGLLTPDKTLVDATSGNTGIAYAMIAAERGYHGRTLGALSATADKKYRAPFEPLPIPSTHVAWNSPEAIEAEINEGTSAIILEPIQGEGGIHVAGPGYLPAVREIATRHKILLIVDEIQSGFRTGAPFASVAMGITPDIIVTAKAIANGFPIGLTLVTKEISESLPGGAHGSTFGGNPLAARAAVETLRIFREDGLYERAATLGAEVVDRIEALQHPGIRAVRGKGLMIGIELKQKSTPVMRGLQERGVLTLSAGSTVIRLLPPLIWEPAHVDEFMEAFEDVLS